MYGERWIWLFSILFTLVILLVTEIIPKVVGVSYNHRLAPVLAPVLSFITMAFRPAIAVTEWISRPFKKRGAKRGISIAELQTMADMAETARTIDIEQETIIINATKLRTTKVKSAMLPRERIALFHVDKSNIENFEVAATSLHTRYPITKDGTADGIIGYVNFKELVASAPSRREVQMLQFIRPLARLPEDANLNEGLRQLLGRRCHMMLVEDKAGRIVGLVTLEDVMEEIVGDLQDEFDNSSAELIEVDPKRWKAGGAVPMNELVRRVGVPMPDCEPQQSLSAWLRRRLGRNSTSGDVVREAGVTFTVAQTRRQNAHRVLVDAR